MTFAVASDTVTGLQWERAQAGVTDWSAAKQACSGTLINSATARLPTMLEMESIIDYGLSDGGLGHAPKLPSVFSGAPTAEWTSSTDPLDPGSTPKVMLVSLYAGMSWLEVASLPQNSRCVTGPAAPGAGRLIDRGDTAFDPATGLEWQRNLGAAITWANVASTCQALCSNAAGWRPPTIKELQTLVMPGPSPVDPLLSSSSGTFFWSIRLADDDPSKGDAGVNLAWGVDFYQGMTYPAQQSEQHLVRCVRGP